MLIRVVSLMMLLGCSSASDPLKNSKKLMKEGHATLYNNGAFQIPSTKIKLIPAGPEPMELAKELTGVQAKASFLKYVNEAKESVVVIWEGGKKTYHFSKTVDQEIDESLSSASKMMKAGSSLLIKRSFAESKEIVAQSFKTAHLHSKGVRKAGREVKKNLYAHYEIKLPKSEPRSDSGKSLEDFSKKFEGVEKIRKDASKGSVYLLGDSFRNYEDRVSKSFSRAGAELSGNNDKYGPSLAIVKSLYWVLDGILWEGIIAPIGKVSAGAIGYTLVNGVAYPVIFMTKQGVTSAKVAVEVVKDASTNTYEVIAPSLEVGLSAILSGTRKVTGFVVGNSLEYIASPLVYGTESLVGSVGGVAVGVTGGTLAGASRVTGEVLGVTSKTVAKTAQGLTIVGGVSFYAIKGTAEFAYEVTRATVVPSSLVLGSGLALSYGTISQLSAQTVLAVADASYLVLSLEGPQWVIYAVSGKLGDKTREGEVLDLEEMKKDGEEFKKVPVSDEELQNVLKSLHQ